MLLSVNGCQRLTFHVNYPQLYRDYLFDTVSLLYAGQPLQIKNKQFPSLVDDYLRSKNMICHLMKVLIFNEANSHIFYQVELLSSVCTILHAAYK